ncbi:NADH-quinone oxidoreductase subunit M [Paenibacillus phyllosphaerae]|uniref:NADH-quinone oxidoreductase subunit M n=1 Tax=Paenibacillus phyllosphaerae TaxID=274593 RepID=A0A7W5AXD0_9BACL|nr:NADH-quinone oxidoreductase subunit M [Paenibacillus phyllosphaerae]MBB3110540.1 NADH-quinone oxidoreductase subunit M [Paenibacillus phyllosphaerae]
MIADIPILSMIVFSPLLGLLAVALLPKSYAHYAKWIAFGATLIPLGLTLWLYAAYDAGTGGTKYAELATWVNASLNKEFLGDVASYTFKLQYQLGVDGLSLPLLLLTTVVASMAALASVHIKKRRKSFYLWFLVLEVGMLGVFLARDLILFFMFFELTLIPMFFLIGIWGFFGREKAASRFLIYNGLGSAIMLVAFLLLVVTAGFQVEQTGQQAVQLSYSGSYDVLLRNFADPNAYVNLVPDAVQGGTPFYMSESMRWTVFLLLLAAFGIKLPVFPFHTWMLKVHVEAPPSIVMVHSGVLLKMGAYGLLRFGIFLFPAQVESFSFVLALLGVINLLYGAILAFVQKDFKLVLAYSSISHMGIVLLGLASLNGIGLNGAVIQLVSHGLISALLFLVVGSLQERAGTTDLQELGGFARSMPFMSGILLAAGLASIGLPGLSGFVGELLALLGLYDTQPALTAVAVLGIILSAAYMLRSVLAITFGQVQERFTTFRDARLVEAVPMIVLLALIVLIGVYPAVLTSPLKHSFDFLLGQLSGGGDS